MYIIMGVHHPKPGKSCQVNVIGNLFLTFKLEEK
jgi:hypothetical protein